MTTVQVPVSDDLIQKIGQRAVEDFLQKQLQILRVQSLADGLGKAIDESGVDWDTELETARQEAWEAHQR